MLDDIMDSVVQKLGGLFPDYGIYTDETQQGAIGPCFFVGFEEVSERPLTGRRYCREMRMYIRYVPDAEEQSGSSWNRVVESLMDATECITLPDGLLRGTQRRFVRENGNSRFLVSFSYFMTRPADTLPAMEQLEAKIFKGEG